MYSIAYVQFYKPNINQYIMESINHFCLIHNIYIYVYTIWLFNIAMERSTHFL